MIPYDGLAPDVFERKVATVLVAPHGQLVSKAEVLTTGLAPEQVAAFIDKRLGDKPSVMKHLATLIAIPMGGPASGPAAWLNILPSARTSALLAATITHVQANTTYRRRQGALQGLIHAFDLSRAAIGLDDRERGLARAMAALFAKGAITATAWDQFSAQLIWADGAAELTPGPALREHRHLTDARQLLADLLKLALPPHKTFLAETAARIASDTATTAEVRRLLSPGARWLDANDAATGAVLTTKASPIPMLNTLIISSRSTFPSFSILPNIRGISQSQANFS